MNKEHKENNSLVNKELETGKGVRFVNSRLLSPKRKFGTASVFQLGSAIIQVVLGALVIILSAIEIISPVWLATGMIILGSMSIVSGLVKSFNIFFTTK